MCKTPDAEISEPSKWGRELHGPEALGLAYPKLTWGLPTLSLKVKVHTLDIAPLRSESSPQKRSGMTRVLKGFHSFTCTPTRSYAIGMRRTCLCLPS